MLKARRKPAEELALAVEPAAGKGQGHKLARVFERVEHDFDPVDAPVERIVDTVTEAVQRQTLAPPRRMARRLSWLWRPAMIFTVLGVFAALSILSEQSPPNAEAVVEGALSAIEEPGKITYYKVVGRGLSPRLGGAPMSETEEHWVDYQREMEKVVFRSGGENVHRSLTKNGRSISVEQYGSMIDASDNRAIQPFSDRLKDEMGNYRAWVKEGIRPMREEKVNGVETFRIQKEMPLEDMGRVDGRKLKTIWAMNVRKDNFYPVRTSYDAYLVDSSGKMELERSQIQEIEGLRLLDPSVLPPDLFTLDIPKNAPYRIGDGYTKKNIGDFKEFDVYYIGERFDDFKFDGGFSYENERNTNPLVQGIPQAMVRVHYVNETGDDGLSIQIWPKFDINVLLGASYSGGNKTRVDIGGHPATLVETDWGAISTSVLIMERGNSIIHMDAKKTDTLMRAAQKLTKVN